MITEDFGNPWMTNLQELDVPEPIAWWPPAPGWYAVPLLVLAALIWLVGHLVRRRRASAYRRAALLELKVLRQRLSGEDRGGALADLPALIKRTALAAYPRAQVAHLYGRPWLTFLDLSLGAEKFSRHPGQLLSVLPYQPLQVSDSEAKALLALTRSWIKHHRRTPQRPTPNSRFSILNSQLP